MKLEAIAKAQERLGRAKSALDKCKISKNFREFAYYWTDLLTALNQIPAALEKGAKDKPQSRQWYGGKKVLGRQDPLLRYLAQARNADEHGIEPVVASTGGGLSIGARGEAFHIKDMIFDGNSVRASFHPVDGKYPTVTLQGPRPILIPVTDDRFDQTFYPPKEHLGEVVVDDSPVGVGALGLEYYEKLVDEASKLPK